MKSFVTLVGSLLLLVFLCTVPQSGDGVFIAAERPVVNLPVALRQINWLGPRGTGSCAWASLVMDLNWEGEYQLAKKIRATHGDGVTVQSLCKGMSSEGIPYVWTAGKNDIGFLEQGLTSRRGVMVGVNWEEPTHEANHMVLLTHMDSDTVCLIDNNYPNRDRWMSRAEFERMWCDTGSIALVPLYSPVPPKSL